MTARSRATIRAAAGRLGFGVKSVRDYVRRPPGTCRNEDWHEVRLACPCGRSKQLHLRAASAPALHATLRDHLAALDAARGRAVAFCVSIEHAEPVAEPALRDGAVTNADLADWADALREALRHANGKLSRVRALQPKEGTDVAEARDALR